MTTKNTNNNKLTSKGLVPFLRMVVSQSFGMTSGSRTRTVVFISDATRVRQKLFFEQKQTYSSVHWNLMWKQKGDSSVNSDAMYVKM
jgi:hypothetical protein